jgi:D-alanine-D-alanine ligase
MRVAVLHNARPEALPAGLPDDAFEEYDTEETLASVAGALRGLPAEVDVVPADRRLPWRLQDGRFDFAFNMAEGDGGRCREAIPAAVCELLGLPFTGSDALTLALALDKALARRAVSPDVPVARALLIRCAADEAGLSALAYPVFVKPNDEGSSKGIREDALAGDAAAAAEGCRRLRARYGCPVLVEEFLPGPEVTVGVVGNGERVRVLGMMEIAAADPGGAFIYSVEVKRDFLRRVRYHMPPRLPQAAREALEERALTAYRLLGCRDVARLDFRCDADGEPRFLECNPLPGLNPETSDLAILSREILPYGDLVRGILTDAARRLSVGLS